MNGDIVSAQPEIQITLRDENRLLALNDPQNMTLELRYPNESSYRSIDIANDPTVQFIPANTANLAIENKAKIIFKPNLPDGIYRMSVTGTDKSNNESGTLDYSVDFEVINKSAISNVLNYPNPFTTSTRFVFTLTGAKVPDYMKIQILTVSGKVVKEIDKSELGNIKVGQNLTDYAWDGKDEFGQQLANGVYLYRVITKDNTGNDYSRYDNAKTKRINQYFKSGYGKMYLMR
jgi:hypothetical protein